MPPQGESPDPLALFSPPVAAWFRGAFGTPTPPQAQGWPVIARGDHALILSPTGSGKTLTAFLWSLDVLLRELQETPEPESRRGGRRSIATARGTIGPAGTTSSVTGVNSATRQLDGGAQRYEPGVRVVYVSPLKALNNDVERNLQVPLRGIEKEAARLGQPAPNVRVAVRTGDTPSNERQAMLRRPPHILITTPESLYLMLTAERARAMFATVHTVIVDEIHTLVGTKRGAHLTLTLERLERLAAQGALERSNGLGLRGSAGRRVQRIGLSATVRPLENAARFLGGQAQHFQTGTDAPRLSEQATPGVQPGQPRPVSIVDAGSRKPMDLRVVTPVDDFRDVPGNSIWPLVVPEVVDLIEQHQTTLVFCNNRRLAERTADRLNEQRLARAQHADRSSDGDDGDDGDGRDRRNGSSAGSAWPGDDQTSSGKRALLRATSSNADIGMFAAGIDSAALEAVGLQPIRAHHGSMSKVARLEMEGGLKAGQLPALVATSSLELGIDIGEIDLVVHLQAPKSVGAGLQRVGRSGHLVGQTPKGRIFPTFAEDVIEAAAVARGMLAGEIESTATPENPLDILAQHLVAMVGTEDWTYAELLGCVRSAYPFRNLSEPTFRSVLEMLAGKYPSSLSSALRPKLTWDRVNDRLSALPHTRLLATGSGGTIPDRGMYSLVLPDHKTKVGELDEEFVFETRVGDAFLLGSQVWRAVEITEDRVIAEPAPGEVPRMPFWRGDYPWRPYDLGQRIGTFRRELAELIQSMEPEALDALLDLDEGEMDAALAGQAAGAALPRAGLTETALRLLRFLRQECALDRNSLALAVTHVTKQLDAVGHVATDRTIVVESYEDEVGAPRMVLHSPFGGRVNGPWGIALAGALRDMLGIEVQVTPGDDGILLRFGESDAPPPPDVVARLSSQDAREYLLKELPASPVFGAQFRMNAARALLLPREQNGKRTSLWLSRLKAKDLLQAVSRFEDFPILLETYRDCLRDVMDLTGLSEVLEKIEQGQIQVVTHESERPSPLAAGLDYRFAMRYVYEYDQPRGEAQLAALSLNRALLADLLQDGTLADLLKPEAVTQVTAHATRTAVETRARSAEELAQLLYELGDLTEAEIAKRSASDDFPSWLARLEASGRVAQREIGGETRWVSAERASDYLDLAHHPLPVLRRYLMHAGPTTVSQLVQRYDLPPTQVRETLTLLADDVVAGPLTPGTEEEQWIDRRALEQMHRRTLTLLRKEVRPVPLTAYADFLARWQGAHRGQPRSIGSQVSWAGDVARSGAPRSASLEATLRQLRGLAVTGVAWERDVLPLRLPEFDAAELAERCQNGEILWTAEGGKDPRRARVRFFFRGEGALFLDRRPDEETLEALSADARAVRSFLQEEGATLLPDICEATGLARGAAQAALVELVLAGLVTNDTLAALHAVLGFETPSAARPAMRSSLEAELAARLGRTNALGDRPRAMTPLRWRDAKRRARETVAARLASDGHLVTRLVDGRPSAAGTGAAWTGRWSLVHRQTLLGKALPEEELALRRARLLLERWGIVSKARLEREAPVFGWDALYPTLARLEVRGEVRRGYFVEGLPGAQFALPEAVERLRAVAAEEGAAEPVVLSAVDPAQIFGPDEWGTRLRFARVAQAAVASQRGEPVAVMTLDEEGAAVQALDDHPALVPSLRALAAWWEERSTLPGRHLKVTRWGGDAAALEGAGFVREGSGMMWVG